MKAITFNYTLSVNDMNKTLLVDTSKIAVTITVPKITPSGFKVTLIGVGGTESTNNITIAGESDATINDSASVAVANDRPVILINKTSDNGSNYNLVTNAGSGGGGDSGWTLGADSARLNDDLGLNFGLVSDAVYSFNPYSVIDTSSIDVQASIDDLETEGQLKIYKVQGENNIILDSIAGFSDGTQTLAIYDSAIIIFDGTIWQILYNNEWKTKVVDVSSAEILTMGTTPVELLPSPGAGKYYEIESILTKYTHVTTAYDFLSALSFLFGGNAIAFIEQMINIASNSVKKSLETTLTASLLNSSFYLSTQDSSDPILGDGTLQVIIKYKVNTF
jgi:hypothetical protein